MKLSWDDDNLFNFDGTINTNIRFKIQRRKIDETVYESFPIFSGNFLIDEVASTDAIDVKGQALGIVSEQILQNTGSLELSDKQLEQNAQLRRAYQLPAFLIENNIYFYKVSAIRINGDESNPSEEFKVLAVPDLLPPGNFKSEIVNKKNRPIIVKLTWNNDLIGIAPDFWTLHRKVNVENDNFSLISKIYNIKNIKEQNIYLDSETVSRKHLQI